MRGFELKEVNFGLAIPKGLKCQQARNPWIR